MSNITLSANQGAGTYTVTGTAQTQNGPLIQTIFIDVPTIQIAHSDAYIAPPPTHNDTPRPVCYDRVAVLSAFGDTPDMACSMPAQYNYYIANNNFIYADQNCSDFSNAYGYISDNGGMWFHVRGGRIVGRGACVAPQTTQPTGVSSGTPSGAGHSDTYGQNNDMMI